METKVFETFREIGHYDIHNLTHKDISCFNGDVRITKLRVTIEQVEEPIEVLTERLQHLWENADNHHHYTPIQNKAKKLGIVLVGDFGSKRKR